MIVSENNRPKATPFIKVPAKENITTNENFLIDNLSLKSFFVARNEGDFIESHNGLFLSKIFTLSFNYLQEAHLSKVLKVTYRNGDSIYKVALSSKISTAQSICWLQFQQGCWVMLLGKGLDERLICAITMAIEGMETIYGAA
jgi:hypothetical protein